MTERPERKVRGRGAQIEPANRFLATRREDDWEQLAADDELLADDRRLPTEFLPDASQSIISENDSPDIGFRYSINPYRGCEHGCAYCYARPGHEYLGFNAGLDFETKVMVKHDAPTLLRKALARPSWRGESIAISGVTDCYQPAERRFGLTRGLLQVALEFRQSVSLVTKNALVLRDLDLLRELAALNLVQVYVSVTTLDAALAGMLEPRTSRPAARLEAVRRLVAASVPVGVLTAPVIPAVNDSELPALLRAAAEAGARTAGYVLLRLPLAVRPIFEDWLARNLPDRAERVLARVRDTRGGQMNDAEFGRRMRGQGEYAAGIRQTFEVFARRYGLDQRLPPHDTSLFRRPDRAGQRRLFEE
jgi:DNA repair photolyase